MPAVGPLVAGHVMLVSKYHVPSLASMGREAISEYDGLVAQIVRNPGYSTGHVLEAEHGASEHDSGGACITHAHVNVIPTLGQYTDLFDGHLKTLLPGCKFVDIEGAPSPYILLRGMGVVRLYDATGTPSQLIRRALCRRLGREDWDWAAFPNLERVEETLRLWGND